LLGVSQANSGVTTAPHTRTYTYDSLSRLLSVTDPEMQVCTTGCVSGTTSFSYDSDSNVITRQRPAPNQTGTSTVTTTYTYDALDRNSSTSYNDGVTPTATRAYDETSIFGVSPRNPIGRLTHTVSAPSNYVFSIYDYDNMGRVLKNWQGVPYYAGTGSQPI